MPEICSGRRWPARSGHPKYELLASNALTGQQTNSSIVISNGEIFIRTFRNLWCISEKK